MNIILLSIIDIISVYNLYILHILSIHTQSELTNKVFKQTLSAEKYTKSVLKKLLNTYNSKYISILQFITKTHKT